MESDDFFFFKGRRNYVHSSNVFDHIRSHLPSKNVSGIDFTISRTFANKWRLASAITPEEGKKSVVGRYKDDQQSYYILDRGETIDRRRDYQEDRIAHQSELQDDRIIVPGTIGEFSFIEKVNAAFKTLLQTRIFASAPSDYYFLRITLQKIPDDGFTIRYKRIIANRFVEGEIIEDDNPLGRIYFIGKEHI